MKNCRLFSVLLAVSVEFAAGEGYTKQWDVNGENVTFTVAKA